MRSDLDNIKEYQWIDDTKSMAVYIHANMPEYVRDLISSKNIKTGFVFNLPNTESNTYKCEDGTILVALTEHTIKYSDLDKSFMTPTADQCREYKVANKLKRMC